MTFREFQATRKPATAIELEQAGLTPNEQTKHGLIYAGSLYIESTEGWEGNKWSKWYLLIERSEYLSDDLEQLEMLLYDFGYKEHFFEEDERTEP